MRTLDGDHRLAGTEPTASDMASLEPATRADDRGRLVAAFREYAQAYLTGAPPP